jgi:hypothetical protein
MHFNSKGVRLAALQLSVLPWLDRRWILGQLPQAQRLEVKAALAELKKLKISNGKELLQQLTSVEHHRQNNAETPFMQQLELVVLNQPDNVTPASQALLKQCLLKAAGADV